MGKWLEKIKWKKKTILPTTKKSFHFYSATKVTPKDSFDGNSNDFNSAYSIEVTANQNQSETDHTTVDTFDHILQMTSHHEAVYAYYYMDDNNKVSWW